MARSRKGWWLALLALAVVSGLTGCKKGPVADDPQRDRQTEAQREHDCADPQWKAANLGLWYNMCSGGGAALGHWVTNRVPMLGVTSIRLADKGLSTLQFSK